MRFYKQVDLPKIPSHLYKWPLKVTYTYGGNRRGYIREGKIESTSTYDFYELYENNRELYDWLVSNIYPNCTYKDKIRFHCDHGAVFNGPHTDRKRVLAFNYYFDLGGEKVETIWYKHKHKRIFLGEGHYPTDYNLLDEQESVIFESNVWYLLNVGVIHGVENLKSPRKYVSLSYFEDDLKLLDPELLNWFLTNSELSSSMNK